MDNVKGVAVFRLLLMISLTFVFSACEMDPFKDSSKQDSIEAFITSISGVADELGNERSIPKPLFLKNLEETEFQASSTSICPRAKASNCVLGQRKANYYQCGTQKVTKAGTVKLNYARSDCRMTDLGDEVVKMPENLIFRGVKKDNILRIYSKRHTSYIGEVIEGGISVTKTANNEHEVAILGLQKSLKSKLGVEFLNYSIVSVEPSKFKSDQSNKFGRGGRNLEGGVILVHNNKKKFTATIKPNNLKWRTGCCHPVMGTVDIEFSGRETGNAVINFSSTCGNYYYNEDGKDSHFASIAYCE